MIPTNSNRTSPCDPVSSNCVIWQGPDLKFDNPGGCIDICNGDTISDVVAKVAEQLCELMEASCLCDPDMSTIDLSTCLPPATPLNIQDITQAIIDYLCSITPGGSAEIICDVPDSFSQIISPDYATNPITQLPICDYAWELAQQIQPILTSLNSLSSYVTSIATDVAALQAAAAITPPILQMYSKCIMGNVTTLFPIDVLVNALESQFCDLRASVGNPGAGGDIELALASICIFSGSKTVNNPGVSYLGEYAANWISNPSTMAQSQQDLWIVVCDLYKAIQGIHANCCPKPCEGLIYDFTAVVGSGGSLLTINWNLSDFPPPYHDCAAGSLVTVTDTFGLDTSAYLQPAMFQASYAGQDIDVSMLTPNDTYSVQVDFCITDAPGPNTCQFTLIKSVPAFLPCPSPVTFGPNTISTIPYAFNNSLTGNVTYSVSAVDSLTLATAGSSPQIFVETGVSAISGTITGLASGTLYNMVIEIWPTLTPASKVVCQSGQSTTDPIVCADTSIGPGAFVPQLILPPGLAVGTRWLGGNLFTYSVSDDVNLQPQVDVLTTVAAGAPGNVPIGTDLGSDTIDCGGVPFVAAGATWWLVNAWTSGAGVINYIYAAWNDVSFALDQVFACCTCPTIILDDYTLECQIAGTVIGTPVATVFGPPVFSINDPPEFGIAAVTNPLTGAWSYTHPGTDIQSDSFGIAVTTPCGNESAVVNVEVRTVSPEVDVNVDIWAFINTTTVTIGQATAIVTELQAWHAGPYLACAGTLGNLYIACTSDPQVLSYGRAIIDLGQVGPFPITGGAYAGLSQLPTNWIGGGGAGAEPASLAFTETFCMTFCNEGNILATPYTAPLLTDAFVGGGVPQPTTSFYDDWDNLIDMRDQTVTGTWALALLAPALARLQPGGVAARMTAMFTLNNNPLGAEGAWIFMLFGAGSATIMPNKQYRAKATGDTDCCTIPLACLDADTSAITNPYATATSPIGGHSTAGGLQSVNFFTALSQGATYNIAAQLQTDITGMFMGYAPLECPNP